MADPKSDEELPAGCRVEMRARKNGRMDKVVVEKVAAEGLPPGWIKEIRVTKKARKVRRDPYYTDPASGYVFRSMKDALRYLKTGEIGRLAFKPNDKDSNDEDFEDDEICSPTVAKKQKLAVSGTGSQIEEGQSSKMSEVAKVEEMLKFASPGECISLSEHTSIQCGMGTELSSSNLSEAKGAEQTEGGKDFESSSNLSEAKGAEQTEGGKDLESSSNLSEAKVAEQTEGGKDFESSSNLSEAKGAEQIEGGRDFDKSVFSAPAVGVLTDKQYLECTLTRAEIEKPKVGRRKSKDRKELHLPRRASKRLAGLALDPTPELKTSNRARRVAVKQSGEVVKSTAEGSAGSCAHRESQLPAQLEADREANCAFDTSRSTDMSLESNGSTYPYGDLATPNEHAGKVETENKGDKKQGCIVDFPLGSLAIPEEHGGNVETDDMADEKPRLPLDLPCEDLWTDPCIAFAIKTLTGIPFETSKSTELSPGSNNSTYPSGGLGSSEEHSERQETGNEGDKKQGCTVVFPPGNLAIPEEHAGQLGSTDKTDEKPGSPLHFPFASMWTDPCIEFAIKTLTGAIPIEYDVDIQDCYQQQLSSSQTQTSSSLTLPDVGLDNFCQTDILCQQFDTLEKPASKEQAPIEPVFTHTGNNVSSQNSGGTGLPQTVKRDAMNVKDKAVHL